MEITSNYSLVNLFASDKKEVKIFIREEGKRPQTIAIYLKGIRDFYQNDEWATTYTLLTQEDEMKKIIPKFVLPKDKILEPFDYLELVLFTLSKYKEYDVIVNCLIRSLRSLIKDFTIDYNKKKLLSGTVTITSDICNYIIYVLKLSCGEESAKPKIFATEAAREMYLAQLEFEKKIRKIKSKAGDNDSLIKSMLTIIYCIPSFTFDYLFSLTMAQIRWLHNYAAKSASYEITAKAYAAGNLKKGKTPDFFIK